VDRLTRHLALLGDSIFDNAAYTRGEPPVIDHVRRLLPTDWQATLCALDGATTRSLDAQLARVPEDATHLVIAIGGNDALGNIDLLDRPVASTAEALMLFRRRLEDFHLSYDRAIDRALRLGRRTTVCTIYNGHLESGVAEIAEVGLMMFNDVILHAAVERRLDVIELRQVCADAADYANPIEPSGVGGEKIAAAIVRAIGASDDGPPSRVYGR
jgi:hypothetical protein